jgi:hypothetical protein
VTATHTCTPPSSEAVKTSLPDGDITTLRIGPRWPLKAIRFRPPACCKLGM